MTTRKEMLSSLDLIVRKSERLEQENPAAVIWYCKKLIEKLMKENMELRKQNSELLTPSEMPIVYEVKP